jgi:hypothetical protein
MLLPKQSSGIRCGYLSAAIHAVTALRGSIVPAARVGGKPVGLLGVRSLGFNCGPYGCVCTGDFDCNDMFSTNVCGPFAICIDNVCWCSR